jgi:Uma2 family endonuclease
MIRTAVSVEEYLNTSYEPDMEYVDGELVERNLGTQDHADLAAILSDYLREFRQSHSWKVFVDVRLLVNAAMNKHRIPDVLVLKRPYTKGQVVVDIPLVTIEIKSPEDTFDDILEKCFEYSTLGVRNIFVVDPDHRRAFVFADGSLTLQGQLTIVTDGDPLVLPINEMFAELD